jgi:hypothetical protein
MANRLKISRVQSILSLHAQGWSRRRIARELGIDRETVSRYVQLDQQAAALCEPGSVSKPVNAPISGPGSSPFSKPANAPISDSGSTESKAADQKPKSATKRRKAAAASA